MRGRPSGSGLLKRPSYFALWLSGGLTYAVTPAVIVVLVWTVTQAFPGVSGDAHTRIVALSLAFLGLSAALPTLAAATVAGTLADTLPRKSLMRVVNGVQIAAVLGLALDLSVRSTVPVAVPGLDQPLPLYLAFVFPLWAASSTAATIFRPALNASVPRVVQPAELGSANGLLLSFALALSFGGSLVAPVLLDLFPGGTALLVPLGFLVMAQGAFGLIDVPIDAESPPPRRRFAHELAEGYRYLLRQPALLRLTVGALALNFLSNMAFVELGLYVTFVLGEGNPIYLGILYAGANVGAALGSFAVTRVTFEPKAGRWLAALALAQGSTVLALAVIQWYPLAVVDLFLYGVIPGMAVTIFFAVVQATVRNDLLGRVLAADEVGSMSLLPAGQYAGGLATLELGVPATFAIAGSGILLTGVGMAVSRSVRELGFRPHGPDPSADALAVPTAREARGPIEAASD